MNLTDKYYEDLINQCEIVLADDEKFNPEDMVKLILVGTKNILDNFLAAGYQRKNSDHDANDSIKECLKTIEMIMMCCSASSAMNKTIDDILKTESELEKSKTKHPDIQNLIKDTLADVAKNHRDSSGV